MNRRSFSHALAAVSLLVAAAPAVRANADLTDGEVRKVDKAAKSITLKHGEIRNVGMPPMTMAFAVRDPALLDKVKAGDKVKFRVEKIGDDFFVTAIDKAK